MLRKRPSRTTARDQRMLRLRVLQFSRYVRDFGFWNTVVFGLSKIFPRHFVLLLHRVSPNVSLATLSAYYNAWEGSVFDYKDWEALGGGKEPATSVDGRACFIWFVPDWTNVWGGGHYTLFRFANYFSKKSSRNIIFIYNFAGSGVADIKRREGDLRMAIEGCRLEVIVDASKLPRCEGAIATTWQSAYFVRAFNFALEKFYFMQDYESLFYAYGTMSMQANLTYGFGFKGITGGDWLKGRYEAHNGRAMAYHFAADKNIFYPASPDNKVRETVKRLFFYGRPSTERRCFELGMVALKGIAEKHPDLEIVIAGLRITEELPFRATMLGNMSLRETGDLYRTCDIGLAFSGTNLSYLPVELMASGVPVISNNGAQVEWHCKHGENAYLVDPVPQAIVEGFEALYSSPVLRQKLVNGGVASMAALSWENEMEKVYMYVRGMVGIERANSASGDKTSWVAANPQDA